MKYTLIYLALFTMLLASCGGKKDIPNEKADSTDTKTTSTKPITKPVIGDGPYEEKYPDGMVRIKGEMKNGVRSGLWKSFYPNGSEQSENFYEDGKKNGKTATYYKNGRLRYIGYFKWDEPSGLWEFYDSTGTLATRKEYSK